MADVFEIAEILVAHAVQAHGAEIAIIAYYGSYAKGRASPTSDLDIYYVPDEGKAQSLSSQFVMDDLPYDFWGVPWTLLENIVNGSSGRPWSDAASLIADAEVLYHRSAEDLDRFNALKDRVAELTKPESRSIMVGRALDEFKTTLFQLGQMRVALADADVAGTRWAGLKFVHSAVNCLALANQTYFSKGWGANMPEVLAMPHKPADLAGLISAVLTPQDTEHMLAAADRLAGDVRGILRTAQASISERADAQAVFKDFYYYVFEYKNKVLAACAREDVLAAGSAAFHMQEQICQLMNKIDNGFYGTGFNLLGEYSEGFHKAGFPDLLEPAAQADLVELARRVQQLDEKAQQWLEGHSIALNILGSEEELRRFLNQRDPVRSGRSRRS
jgi:hypothetical protein